MGHWFEEVADHLGDAYLRYSFTYGTLSEVDTLIDVLDLTPGPGCWMWGAVRVVIVMNWPAGASRW